MFQGRTYINRLSSYQFEFEFLSWDRTYNDQSFILLVQLEFGVTPISISHHLVSLGLGFLGSHLYLIGYFPVSLSLSFWDRTYID